MSVDWSPQLHGEIKKRMTMNMLIQGAAWQACLTAHHLIKDELDELEPQCNQKLSNSEFYDRFSVAVLMSQWNSEIAFLTGLPSQFWKKVGSGETDFCHHSLLVKHGRDLAVEAKRASIKRCQEKGVWWQPGALSFQSASLLMRCIDFESKNIFALEQLAVKATSAIWSIEESDLRATLTESPEFGNIRVPRTEMGQRLRKFMVGWGGVEQTVDGSLRVVGKSKFWSLLLHELTKGTVELIALHGLNELDEETYAMVMLQADNIEFEVWMMQSGLTLYRRLLGVLPRGYPISEALMYIAKMPAELHESFSMAVIEEPNRASEMFQAFIH